MSLLSLQENETPLDLPKNSETYSVEDRAEPHSLHLPFLPCPRLVPFFLFFFPSVYPFLLDYSIGFRSIDDSTSTTAPSIVTLTTPPPLRFPRYSSSSPPSRHFTSTCSGSSLGRPEVAHSHPTNLNKVEHSQVPPYYTILRDNSTTIGAGGSGDLFWDTCGEYKKGEQPSENDGVGSTRTLSGKWRKNDSDHRIQSRPSVHEFARSSVDKDQGMVKKSPDGPADGSPSRRFWKLVKKISISGLREKNQADSDHPPVPPLPSHLANDPFDTPVVSSLVSSAVSSSASVSSPTTAVDKSALVSSTPPSSLAQHRIKLSRSTPHSPPSQPTIGPRPSTTTRSSSPSSDVASSRFFNRQSARSSTSSLGEEALPPLPETSISTATPKTNGKMNAKDANANLNFNNTTYPHGYLVKILLHLTCPAIPSQ